jgi:hypothetical protein
MLDETDGGPYFLAERRGRGPFESFQLLVKGLCPHALYHALNHELTHAMLCICYQICHKTLSLVVLKRALKARLNEKYKARPAGNGWPVNDD